MHTTEKIERGKSPAPSGIRTPVLMVIWHTWDGFGAMIEAAIVAEQMTTGQKVVTLNPLLFNWTFLFLNNYPNRVSKYLIRDKFSAQL